MDNYLLDGVNEFKPGDLDKGTWLIVHKLHRTPYHIGLITEGNYYSLTVNGAEYKKSAEVVSTLADKAYNNLMIEMKIPNETDPKPYFRKELNENEFHSCLFPIREWLAKSTSDNKFTSANNLFELLDCLIGGKFTGRMLSTRMNFAMEGKIVLIRYDQQTIIKHIKRLKELKDRETP